MRDELRIRRPLKPSTDSMERHKKTTAAQKRRSHAKSRRGCQTCKQKHIKCDEQGPPCANCVARSTKCIYPKAETRKTDSSASSPSKPSISRELSPRLSPDSSPSRRLLELELMHRWSTRTYLGVCSIPQDLPLMQVEVPRKGLQFDCLLNGILALSSLDMAMTSQGTQAVVYNRAAMEYYDKSIQSFREEINNITPENHDSLYLVAVLIGLINIAALQLPRDDASVPRVLDHIPVIFDLLRGPVVVAVRCWEWLVESTESIRIVLAMGEAPRDGLDPGTREAFARLGSINDRLHISTASQAGDDPEVVVRVQAREMHKKAISHLERCFAEEARGWIDGFLIAFPVFAGAREFLKAVRKSDPMALLILTHFAVLLEMHSNKAWWAPSVGKRLVMEISDVLKRSELALVPQFWEALSWARQQVGLPGQMEAGQPSGFEIIEIHEDVE